MTEEDRKQKLFALARADSWRMTALAAARDLDLPDCWIGAGFVRALVWDHVSGYARSTLIDDVDVLYYNPVDLSKDAEKAYDARLNAALPGVPWSCKNQARMHVRFGAGVPYMDTEDGLRHWLETPTAVALRLDMAGELHLLAPFGLQDLFDMRIVPTPYARAHRPEQYIERVTSRPWRAQWPGLEVELP